MCQQEGIFLHHGSGVQAHLSDTMRQALVTLNVVHARDLELQTRIACDDDRLVQAMSRHRHTPTALNATVEGSVPSSFTPCISWCMLMHWCSLSAETDC